MKWRDFIINIAIILSKSINNHDNRAQKLPGYSLKKLSML